MGKKKKRVVRHLPANFGNLISRDELILKNWPPPAPPSPPAPDEMRYEVAFYGYYFFSSRPQSNLGPGQALAVITIYSSTDYVGAISFYADDEQLDDAVLLYRQLTGVWVIGLNYHISQFSDIMDMLRTEPHVYIHYDGPYNSSITTIPPA